MPAPRPHVSRRHLLCAAGLSLSWPALASGCAPLLNHRFPRLQDEKPQDLCQYQGQVLLVVNTASKCGYTSQYRALEALQQSHGPKGLAVLGFPSNDFGHQEPGSNQEIADFCENTFGVKFAMFAKSQVSGDGPGLNPLYRGIRERTGQSPRWNFHKFLIGRDGERIQSHGSAVRPDSAAFIRALESLL